MNIIKQLIDKQGNNIYPIAYAQGGVKIDLLWSNPSPTSAFAGQTIQLDYSDYDLLLVFLVSDPNISSSNNYVSCLGFLDTSYVDIYQSIGYMPYFVTAGIRYRAFKLNSSKNAIEVCNRGDVYSADPWKIYGIKTSYIVPTEVHGLQYVED